MTNKFLAALTRITSRFFLITLILLLTFTSLSANTQAETPFYQSHITADIFQFAAENFRKTIVSPHSTITVNATAMTINSSDGLCTLKEAITAANTNTPSGITTGECVGGSSSGADTIILTEGTYTLTAVDNTDPYWNSPNGLPQITSTIFIQGAGADSTKIERSSATGTPDFRIFYVSDIGSFDPNLPRLTLDGVAVKNGKIPAHFSLNDGGAIYPTGARMEINNCRFENNTAGRFGGAIIIGSSDTTISNSTFTGNTADQQGGAIYAWGVIIANSTFINNTAATGGGAIALGHNSTATISGSTFTNNSATGEGAGGAVNGFTVNISNSIFNENSAPLNSSNANGGAVYARFITVDQSAFTNNTTGGNGGAIGNVPTEGAFVTITNSTFSGNTAKYGGGVYGANTTVNNSTVSGNFAKEHGGGILFNGSASTLNLNNTTITNNTADSDNNGSGRGGGMLHSWSFSQSQMMFIRNTIIAGNINSAAPDCADEFGGTTFSQGYNLIGNNAGCNFNSAPGDQVGTSSTPINPLLGALQNNGGATKTHALLSGSPAIDAANPATPDGTGNACLPTDQRGATRPGDGDENGIPRCDIGAFEIVQLEPTSLAFTVQPSTTTAGQSITPAVQVSILDQFGSLIPDATNSVTIALNNHPGGGTLSGTLTRNATGGIATFDDLSLTRAANGYTLQATSTNLTAATSNIFNITAGSPAQLAFTVQPANTNAFATIIPSVKVAVQDAAGNIVTTATNAVTIAIENNPNGNGILSGTLTRNAVNGIVTFNDLSINQPGEGYLLRATVTGLTQDVSDSFNITRPIFVVTKTADTNDGLCNSDCSLREAITAANALNGTDTINFNIPGSAPFTLVIAANLPDITSPVTIDGTTQPGYSGTPVVGVQVTLGFSHGIVLAADNNIIKGLQLSGFSGASQKGAITVNSNDNVIKGNFIGTNFAGNSKAQNHIGIWVTGSSNIIGGTTPADRNLISGNSVGIYLTGSNNQVIGNYIGTNASGSAALGNSNGIVCSFCSSNTIGGQTTNERNVISGNVGSGISLENAVANVVRGNLIGRNATDTGPVGNGNYGIHSLGSVKQNIFIENTISGNDIGISITNISNLIRSNSIYANTRKGILLWNIIGEPLPNDPGDSDPGGNERQNYPVLATAELSGGNLSVQGSLNSKPNSTYTLEFFSNTDCGPYGYGEGETPIGTTTVATDAIGITDFLALLPLVPPNSFITATATDAMGNTSEFSQCQLAVGESYVISGQLTKPDNSPLPNTQVKLSGSFNRTVITDGNGNYSFTNLPGANYTVTPSSGIYDFNPPNRIYTVLSGNQTNQNFTTTRKAATVSVVVRVDNNGTYYSLGQVILTLSGAVNQNRQTDANGQAFFELHPENNYVLTPSFANYAFTPSSVALPNPVPLNHTIEFVANPTTNLNGAGRLVIGTFDGTKTLNANGSGFTLLNGTHGSPDLSRDGSRIAYQYVNSFSSPPTIQIGVANYDGTEETALTTVGAGKSAPRWSPDKAKIAYLERLGENTDIAIRTISGGATSFAAVNSHFGGLTWNPDSTKIAFHKHLSATATQIYSVNVSGANQTQLTSGSSNFDPDWSPDGTKIAFVRRSGDHSLMVMNSDGSSQTTIYTGNSILQMPRWSPDGSKIAFLELAPDRNRQILTVINADGMGRIELLTDYITRLSWGADYQITTPLGNNVPVTSGGVALSFSGISNAGQTIVSPIPPNSAGTVQSGFVIGNLAYEITTTAFYTAPISVCFTVPQNAAATEAQFNALSLMHNENGVLVDRTTSRNFATRQICGTVDSLSPFALAEQIDSAKPQISGLVLDSNGNPMSGVRMLLTGAETKQAETDTDGAFRFVNLTEGANYNVQPRQLGFIFDSYSQDFVALSGEKTVLFTGTENRFSISGRVTDENGNGIGNVLLQLEGASIAEALTDADGNYILADLPADGSYTIRAFDGINIFSPPEAVVEPLLSDATDINFTQLTTTIPPDNAPVVTNPGAQTNAENDSVSLQIAANDPDGDALTFSASGLPPGLSIGQTTGLISGLLPYTAAGTYNVTITASDGSLSGSVSFTWIVNNLNQAPTAESFSVITEEDTAKAITLLGADADGENLIFSVTGNPSHGTLSGTGANLIYTPNAYYNGSDSFTYVANDGRVNSASATVSITVNPVNNAPTISGATISRQQTAPGTVSTIATVSDADNDASSLSVTTTSPPTGISVTGIANTNGAITATVLADCSAVIGNNSVGLKVTDSSGAMETSSLTINVRKETAPPVINPISNVVAQLPSNTNATSMAVTFPLPTVSDNCGGAVMVTTNPMSDDVFPVGTTTVDVTAADQAGNRSFATFTVTVQYRFSWFYYSGLLLSEQQLNQVTAGSNVPIRFTLSGNKADPYSSPPTSQQISCSTFAPAGAVQVIDRFMPDSYYSSLYDFYQTTWRTQTSWRFTCRRLTLYLNDGTTKTLSFYFK